MNNPKSIFIVEYCGYPAYNIVGVFSTKKKAKAYAKAWNKTHPWFNSFVTEYEIDWCSEEL